MENNKVRYYINILGVSFLFLAFGIWEIIDPDYWLGFVPSHTFGLDINMLVRVHGLILTVIGVLILSGYLAKWAALVGTLVIGHIVAILWISSGFTDLVIRDISLMILTFALFFEDHQNNALLLKRK